jgi:hypothetical protein
MKPKMPARITRKKKTPAAVFPAVYTVPPGATGLSFGEDGPEFTYSFNFSLQLECPTCRLTLIRKGPVNGEEGMVYWHPDRACHRAGKFFIVPPVIAKEWAKPKL